MSYNITAVKQVRLKDFKIPLSAIYDPTIRADWMPQTPKQDRVQDGLMVISCGCGQSIKGTIEGDLYADQVINVSSLELSGEGSGTLMRLVLANAFAKSTGEFQAVLIWEGGDSLQRYAVKNGVITEEELFTD